MRVSKNLTPCQGKMHRDELEINEATVKRLIAEQFPRFSYLPIRKVHSTGTVNAIFRLGEAYCVRLPRLAWANESLHNEWKVLPVLLNNVTLTIPRVVGKGKPNAEYPLDWAIYGWIKGSPCGHSPISEMETASALARFISELRLIQTPEDAPKAGRKPLRELDESTEKAIAACKGDVDVEKARGIWRVLLGTEPWNGKPVWIHADLLKPNLLVHGGRLSAVIDFGSAGVGDPAFDITPAWTVLTSETRERFKNMLCVDDCTWLRAKAYALHQAALIIPYYRKSNPAFVDQAKCTMDSILEDR